jgi:hypothetical protein
MGNTNGSILLFRDSAPQSPPRDGSALGRASRRAPKKASSAPTMLAGMRALIDQQLSSIRLLLRSVEPQQCAIASRQADRLATRIIAIERATTIRPCPRRCGRPVAAAQLRTVLSLAHGGDSTCPLRNTSCDL